MDLKYDINNERVFIKNRMLYQIEIMNKVVEQMPEPYKVMYTISTLAVIRVPELCNLKKNCLLIDNGDYYLKFRTKDNENDSERIVPIDKKLYDIINDWIISISEIESPYMFLDGINPITCECFTQKINDFFDPYDINPIGEWQL